MARSLGSLILKVLILCLRGGDCPSFCLTSTDHVFLINLSFTPRLAAAEHPPVATYRVQSSWNLNLYWLKPQERDL